MSFDKDEKQIIVESLKLYMQLVRQRYSESRVQQVTVKMTSIANKLESLDESNEAEKLPGITDDQFENVCKICDKFKGHCTDVVAKKFPGKCDPILHYNQRVGANNDEATQETAQEER